MPLAIATVVFRRRAARLYDLSRERIAIVNADFQESLSGVRESQAFVHEAATMEHFHGLGRDYLESRLGGPAAGGHCTSRSCSSWSAVPTPSCSGSVRGSIGTGQLTSGALIAFILYIDLFFSPIQQLSQVFDSWQQTRVSVARIAELMRLQTLTPAADDPLDRAGCGASWRSSHVRFAYPGRSPARPGDAARSSVVVPPTRGFCSARTSPARAPEALRGVDLRGAGGRDRGAGRRDRCRQVDHR